MMGAKQILLIAVLATVVLLGSMSAFVVDQREQVMVLQFGNPKVVVRDAGLHFKLPWQSLERFDSRLLASDAPPNDVITKDKKSILVDNYTRWKITDPLVVYQVARTQTGVMARMEDVVRGKIREVLGKHTLLEIVSGGEDATLRAILMQTIRDKANLAVSEFGISIDDVRIKRADLPEENSEAVFLRMKAERQRIAKEYRSQGEEAAKEIRAKADKTRKIVLANAYQKAQVLRGKGEAESTATYARAHNRDPEFYAFMRSLEAYRVALGEETQLVISPESEFFNFFEKATK
ncbi:MAG: protease modulator HflC [Mariprofundus sp.]